MPRRKRQNPRNAPHVCVRRRVENEGESAGAETKRACGDETGSGWRWR